MKNLKFFFAVILSSLFFINFTYATHSVKVIDDIHINSKINYLNLNNRAENSTIYKIVMAAMFGPEKKKVKIFNHTFNFPRGVTIYVDKETGVKTINGRFSHHLTARADDRYSFCVTFSKTGRFLSFRRGIIRGGFGKLPASIIYNTRPINVDKGGLSAEDIVRLKNTAQRRLKGRNSWENVAKEVAIIIAKTAASYPLKQPIGVAEPSTTTTSRPRPSTTRPRPTSRPRPSTTRPQPTSRPRPSTTRPRPTSRPRPSTTRPRPTSRPRPSTTRPRPTSRPRPSTTRPRPTSRPRPSTTRPRPTSRPRPSTTRPRPTSRPRPSTIKSSQTISNRN